MSISTHILPGPLPPEPVAWQSPPGAGAVVRFEGVARPREGDRAIDALDYEAYEPMASRTLRGLAERICAEHGLLGICVEHSAGRVAVGECSFRLRVAGAHRREALAAMGQFIDQLKQDVPIWKKPVWA